MPIGFFDELALEQAAKSGFGVPLEVGKLIVQDIPVSRVSRATVFLTKKKQLYCYVYGQGKLSLGDVRKIISRMGLKAELYVPPKGQPMYFDEVGRAKFLEVFPGRGQVNHSDIVFYRTLAPYSPALVLISEVRDGEVLQYDDDARGKWRVAAKFAYRRIRTS